MKAKPAAKPGAILLELDRRDESMFAAASLPKEETKLIFTLKKVLVPVDFSECSRKALRYAIPLAEQHGADLALIYVVPRYYETAQDNVIDWITLESDLRAGAEKQLAELRAVEVGNRVQTSLLVRLGAPAEEIIAVAKTWPSDLIIISTHGRTGLRHVLLGSVAEKIVRHAPCPVLVVREAEREFVRE